MVKYLSTFSGIGGFELGIEKAFKLVERITDTLPTPNTTEFKGGGREWEHSFDCIGYSEIDKYAIQIYEKQFKGHRNYGDITRITTKSIPDFDLFVGGFPCQSFSIAGKRKGFEDTRGTMFFEIARILKDKRPQYFILENVKGLLSHDKGKTFKIVIETLDELGYFVEWQVLNSKNFGVPQNRERVFIVGHLGGNGRPKVFPLGQNDEIFNGQGESEKGQPQAEISTTVRNKSGKADGTYIVHNVYGGFGEKKMREFHEYSPTIRTPKGGGHIPMVAKPMIARGRPKMPYEPGKRELNYSFYEDACPTLTENAASGDQKNIVIQNKISNIRRLTPVECERLQGFPDNWTAFGIDENGNDTSISDTQRYKVCGNAVTVNVVEYIVSKLFRKQLSL